MFYFLSISEANQVFKKINQIKNEATLPSVFF